MKSFLRDKFTHRPKTKEQSWTHYYEANEALFGTLIFVGGFLFDVFTLSDVDDPLTMIQQAVYLLLIGTFIYFETLESLKSWSVPRWLQKIWVIREIAMHFLLGSLLSLYSLFFFKSASVATSFVFLIVMAALLVANEFPQLQKRGPLVRWALWTLCLLSYLQILLPIALGYVGWLPFLLAWLVTTAALGGVYWLMTRGMKEFLPESRRLLWPSGAALVVFLVLYIFKMVPPVPIALKDIGIYHKVEKVGDQYILTFEKPWWKFWHRGDQDFQARPGDVIYTYFAVSSPGRIQDRIKIRWMYKDPRAGWQRADAQEIQIRGGRGDGYRGFAFKRNFQEGDWRVQVETNDEREIGRLSFTVTRVAASEPPAQVTTQTAPGMKSEPPTTAPSAAPESTPDPTQVPALPEEPDEEPPPAEPIPLPTTPELPEGQ